MTVGTQLRMGEPARRKLVAAVGNVRAAKHSEAQHLLWHELRRESGLEIAPHRLGPVVDIAMLHTVVDDDLRFVPSSTHASSSSRRMTQNRTPIPVTTALSQANV